MNTARSLKFLESYGNRQVKLWKVLSKYEKLPDHFHDLQTTLQKEFNLLKKATLKNIKTLHEAINLQQMYTTSLSSHINTICAKLAQLEKQIQTHCLYPHSQTDTVQINAPEYNSDIDRQIDIQLQALSHAKNTQEEPAPVTANSEEASALPQDSDSIEPQSKPDQSPAEHQSTETISGQHKEGRRPHLEDILELEEEDWEDGQFANADLIDHHNTTQESDRI